VVSFCCPPVDPIDKVILFEIEMNTAPSKLTI